MCGRVALYTEPDRLARYLQATVDPAVTGDDPQRPGPAPQASWNVAPTRPLLAVREPRRNAAGETEPRVLTVLRWGLVPGWARDPTVGNKMINARAETLATKPAFRRLLARRRCLIPVDGFYEWRRAGEAGGRKVPFYFHRADGRPLVLAGLWDLWHPAEAADRSGEGGRSDPAAVVRTCTVITTEAGEDLADIHNRMPVVLDETDFDTWLDREIVDPDRLAGLLVPAPGGTLSRHPVGPEVNSPRNDGPQLIEEASPQPVAPATPTLFDNSL